MPRGTVKLGPKLERLFGGVTWGAPRGSISSAWRTTMAAEPPVASRGYDAAIVALNSLQTPAKEIEAQRKLGKGSYDFANALGYIRGFARRAGVHPTGLDRLRAVHVAGTKGKGSTCAMVEALLRAQGLRTGLYTSPHLLEARERIRLGSVPISRELFASHFWDCWDQLKSNPNLDPSSPEMPTYFRFLTILAFKIFLAEKVDVAVIEVGLGGAYDATNIMDRPVVCGVTSLGLDHTAVLGPTLTHIGQAKGGIFKPGVPAITAPQDPEGLAALAECAAKVDGKLMQSPPLSAYGTDGVILGIQGDHQRVNASLALQLVNAWNAANGTVSNGAEKLQNTATNEEEVGCSRSGRVLELPPFDLDSTTVNALRDCRWPGRSQQLDWGGFHFYIDGAHTGESTSACAQWFAAQSTADAADAGHSDSTLRVLLFHCTGGRDPSVLLAPFARMGHGCAIDDTIFCPGDSTSVVVSADQLNYTAPAQKIMATSELCRDGWVELGGTAAENTHLCQYFEDAMEQIQKIAEHRDSSSVHVLLTGSLHFVGSFLRFAKVDVQ